jgi:DNA-binding CsgD family transcriptional regulator
MIRRRRVARTLAERFWSQVDKSTSSSCWIWTGYRNNKGYGRIGHLLEKVYVHRLSYELHYGSIPKRLNVCHRCDVPACVNPQHLFLVTQMDNMRDCASKGRNGAHQRPDRVLRGERHGMSKLTDAQRIEVMDRIRSGMTCISIARAFGVSASTVSLLKRGKRHCPVKPTSEVA